VPAKGICPPALAHPFYLLFSLCKGCTLIV
jgi:hypothetical protein